MPSVHLKVKSACSGGEVLLVLYSSRLPTSEKWSITLHRSRAYGDSAQNSCNRVLKHLEMFRKLQEDDASRIFDSSCFSHSNPHLPWARPKQKMDLDEDQDDDEPPDVHTAVTLSRQTFDRFLFFSGNVLCCKSQFSIQMFRCYCYMQVVYNDVLQWWSCSC